MSEALPLNRKARVLVLSASSGAGHVRAAQALEKAFLARGDSTVEHIDALTHVSKVFQQLYDKAYIKMVRRAPGLMGLLYDGTDQPWRHPRPRLALDRLNTQPMIRMLKKLQPDLCIATHFLPAEILAWLIAKNKLPARHAIVVTDYDVHARWLCRTVRGAGKLAGGEDRLATVGFTQEMDQYMAAADLLVGKAGGLTTSEALVRALPMAIVEPIPGQESRNADHLLEAGVAVRCNNLPAAAWKIAGLLECPEKLAAMKRAAAAMARPDAARVIVEDALGLLH
jgi:UDP-N-acetylglucosamine:LPS N-acetylglucosamine transferase